MWQPLLEESTFEAVPEGAAGSPEPCCPENQASQKAGCGYWTWGRKGFIMADDLKWFLYKKLPGAEGLHAIVLSGRDGVPVIKVAMTMLRACFLVFKFFIYLFLDRREGREKERERNIDQLPSVRLVLMRTKPAAQACALTGNQTNHLSLCGKAPNQLSHNGQGSEHAFKPGFLSTFALATDQRIKLGLSKIQSIWYKILTRWFNSIIYLWWWVS